MKSTMKAVVCTQYGGPEVLNVQQVNLPSPKPNELLVKIHATAVTAASCSMRTGKPYIGRLFLGLTKPKITIHGTDLAGEVVAKGAAVKKFDIGDQIVAATDINCGTYAEYICLSQDDVMIKCPQNMNAAEATGMMDGAMTAISFFRDCISLQEGQKILINGASGSIGTAAVQLAKYFGAEVTGVCSGKNKPLVQSLGADHVIDYQTETLNKFSSSYDIVFDTVGKLTYPQCKPILASNGVFLTPTPNLRIGFQMLWTGLFSRQKVKASATGLLDNSIKQKNLQLLKEIIEQGKFKTIIDRYYTLDQIQEAHQYVQKGHKVGNVILVPTQ